MARHPIFTVAVVMFWLGRPVCAQQPPVDPSQSTQQVASPSAAPVGPVERPVSWKRLIPNMVKDQKSIWKFPVQASRGKHVKPVLAFALTTSALVALDPHNAPYFRRTDSFHDFNKIMSGLNTTIGTALVPISAYFMGLAKRDSYAQQTALLAGEAVAGAQILTTIMKDIDRRLRPIDVAPDGSFSDTWFKSKGNPFRGRGSFPSGHTIGAFCVATVFAKRYPQRWVPWVAYGLAAAVGFSRVTLQSHFFSDVFAGAMLGYVISNYVVLNPR